MWFLSLYHWHFSPTHKYSFSEAEAEQVAIRARDLSGGITNASFEKTMQLKDIAELDSSLRNEVRRIADIKNRSTSHVITTLRHVSQLQSDLANLPPVLTSFDTDFRLKGTCIVHLIVTFLILFFSGVSTSTAVAQYALCVWSYRHRNREAEGIWYAL